MSCFVVHSSALGLKKKKKKKKEKEKEINKRKEKKIKKRKEKEIIVLFSSLRTPDPFLVLKVPRLLSPPWGPQTSYKST